MSSASGSYRVCSGRVRQFRQFDSGRRSRGPAWASRSGLPCPGFPGSGFQASVFPGRLPGHSFRLGLRPVFGPSSSLGLWAWSFRPVYGLGLWAGRCATVGPSLLRPPEESFPARSEGIPDEDVHPGPDCCASEYKSAARISRARCAFRTGLLVQVCARVFACLWMADARGWGGDAGACVCGPANLVRAPGMPGLVRTAGRAPLAHSTREWCRLGCRGR